jgi:hypothetical protein
MTIILFHTVLNKQEQHFTFVRMSNLPAVLPNATSLVTKFFAEMSKKRQPCAVINLENNLPISPKFTDTVIVSKYYLRISGKMGFTIENKALIIKLLFIMN